MCVDETKLDIAVAGAGPAGAVAAIMLARAGYRVGVVTLPSPKPRIEGLSPRVSAILNAHALPMDGVSPPSQRQVRWGAFEGAQNVEQIVDRRVFDQGLLNCAKDAGVHVWTGSIRTVSPETGTIFLKDGREMRARLLFEARGRRAPRWARQEAIQGPETISLTGAVPNRDLGLQASEISALPNGWVWRVPLQGFAWVQVVTDIKSVRGVFSAKERRAALWRHVLGEDPIPDQIGSSAAGLRLTAPDLDPRCPSLGDAAVALDPLSGHGLFWAISSALMALPMARSIFDGKPDLARAFYRDRVIDTFWRQARVGRDFYALSGFDGPFWAQRQSWPDARPSHPEIGAPQLVSRIVNENGVLSRREVLLTNEDPGGAAFVLGQEIAPIVRALGPHGLPALAEFQTRIVPHLSPPVAQRLHGWLTQRGVGNSPMTHSQTT